MLKQCPFRSRYKVAAVIATAATMLLVPTGSVFTILPLVLFGGLCLIAPFVQRLSFFLPIVRKGNTGRMEIAITFDDGPDPATTPILLDLLAQFNVRATFFVIGRKAAAYPDLITRILDTGHDIGNHSDSHDVFLMLKKRKTIEKEIQTCQERLAPFSIRPRLFRPPVGITNPHLGPVLEDLGLVCTGFSCRAKDFGNRRTKAITEKVLARIRPDDILLLHDCAPHGDTTPEQWLKQVEGILEGLLEKQLQVVPLSRLIDQPVMEKTGGDG